MSVMRMDSFHLLVPAVRPAMTWRWSNRNIAIGTIMITVVPASIAVTLKLNCERKLASATCAFWVPLDALSRLAK
jgi:hypothetical protein